MGLWPGAEDGEDLGVGAGEQPAERADPAAVRSAVIASPSIRAVGCPVVGAKVRISAWWTGWPALALLK